MFVCWNNTRWHRKEMLSYHCHNPGDTDDLVVVAVTVAVVVDLNWDAFLNM